MSVGDTPIRGLDDLLALFQEACAGPSKQLLGTESEKFGVLRESLKPLSYDGERCGIVNIFQELLKTGEWTAVREAEDAPIIALERGSGLAKASITLEPGAQLELSGGALETVHETADELQQHLRDLAPVSEECGVQWLALGYHPLATQAQLPWVPKQRYRIMREYFPTLGSRGLDMMRRTATVQVNLDFDSEEDAMRKLRIALLLAPVATAIFANSPFEEGKPNGMRSERGAVWLDADPYRTGLLPALCVPGRGFVDYVNWALDVPMYMFKRRGEIFANTGQPFRSFWQDGYKGERPTRKDWETHLNTLFPEARLKNTLEMRSIDSLPERYYSAVAAIWAGLFYDAATLERAEALCADIDVAAMQAARPDIARRGMAAELAGKPIQPLALEMLQLAQQGLANRAKLNDAGKDEGIFLEPLIALCERGLSPADELLAAVAADEDDSSIGAPLSAERIAACAGVRARAFGS